MRPSGGRAWPGWRLLLTGLTLSGCVTLTPAPRASSTAAVVPTPPTAGPVEAAVATPTAGSPPLPVTPPAHGAPSTPTATAPSPAVVEAALPVRIRFSPGSSSISHLERQKIARWAAALAGNPEVRLALTAGADDFVRDSLNQELAQARLQAVAQALIRAGVASRRLELRPLAVDRPGCVMPDCPPARRSVTIVPHRD